MSTNSGAQGSGNCGAGGCAILNRARRGVGFGSRHMRIHAICLTRNEADVIEHCLREAAGWADRIYVYDGASTDGTWDRVQAMKSERIVPWRVM